jgi:hypothetical protein
MRMMLVWGALLVAFLLPASMFAGAVTQDFSAYGAASGLPDGQAEVLGLNSLAFPGFTLSTPGGQLQLDAPGYYGAVNYELLGVDGSSMTITFNAAQTEFSFDVRDFSGYGGLDTISVYGADDVTLLATYGIMLNGSIVTFTDSGESALIGAVSLSIVGGEYWSGILQSVTYNGTSAVPEPATAVLFGAGMLGLAGLLRRRRR